MYCFLWGGSATTNSDDDGKANQCLNYIFLHVHFLFFTLSLIHIFRSTNDEQISLSGDWKYQVAADTHKVGALPVDRSVDPNLPTSLYNAMIHPLISYGIRGAIWYQGENNSSRAVSYTHLDVYKRQAGRKRRVAVRKEEHESASGRGVRSQAEAMRIKKALAVSCKGEIWWAIRDSNPEPTD